MQTNQDESVKFEELNTSLITGQDAKYNSQIAQSRNYPRSIKQAVQNAIDIVILDIQSASLCTYSVINDGKAITGPTVHLAKTLSQCWGNMYIEAKIESIDSKFITSQAIAIDLQNNLAYKVEVKKSISNHKGKFADDMITLTGTAAASIAMRNAVFAVIPRAVIDKVYNEAKKMITGDLYDIEKLKAKRREVFNNLNQLHGVTDQEILLAIGKSSIDYVSSDDIIVLIGITTAVKDGDTTIETTFKKKSVASSNLLADKEIEVAPITITETKAFQEKRKHGEK